jgi:hypothetical protein
MADIHNLLNQIAAQETQLGNTQFLAPCVRGGRVRTSVAKIVYTFTPQPQDFEGWGIFQPVDGKTAKVMEEPSLPQLAEYLKLLKPLRLRLAYVLQGQTWLAYPVNESDMQQRLGAAKPVPVHLVTEAVAFEPIIARFDGSAWWFDEIDRRAEPQPAEQLKEQLRQLTIPQSIQFSGMTPEMLTVYDLALQQSEAYQAQVWQQQEEQRLREIQRQQRQEARQRYHNRLQQEALLQQRATEYQNLRYTGNRKQSGRRHRNDEGRLRDALQMGGGNLQEFRDRGDFWQVEWTTGNGERHTSAISKGDLTVISSGICLSGGDRNFDLQSLVGVIEARDHWDF